MHRPAAVAVAADRIEARVVHPGSHRGGVGEGGGGCDDGMEGCGGMEGCVCDDKDGGVGVWSYWGLHCFVHQPSHGIVVTH